jgi:thiosulfate/3-mercaptopyruvate sulfurtransferase
LELQSYALLSPRGIRGDEKKTPDPWPSSQTLQPGGLAGELAGKNGTPPTVVYVGFHTLFAGGHIAGASFNGTASSEQGLADLKKWADGLPRSTNLVIYCGCCPFEKCPNIRPAYTALSAMGFKKLRVLVLPANFATDWVDKGYPIQKGM